MNTYAGPTAHCSSRLRGSRDAAFTLIELTVVVSILLGLVSISLVGVGAYKEGANRAVCIQNVANAQRAIRVYCNFHEYAPGQPVENLKEKIVAPGSLVIANPVCPSGGSYEFADDRIPDIGALFMKCSLESHQPRETAAW